MTLSEEAQKYISTISHTKLKGRKLTIPSRSNKRRNILFIYGSHSSIERNYGLAEAFAAYGTVINPDLPGFGGMESYHKINKQPDIEQMADYVADMVRKYTADGQKLVFAGFSQGLFFANQALGKYPELADRVELVVSIAGFSNRRDFAFSRIKHRFYIVMTWLLKHRIPATIYRYVFLNGWWLRKNYEKSSLAKSKFKGLSTERKKELLDMEVHLWHINDVQTWAHTLYDSLTADQSNLRINLPVWHIKMGADQYFDSQVVVNNLKVIYKKVHVARANLNNHSPTVIATAAEAEKMIPAEIKRALS